MKPPKLSIQVEPAEPLRKRVPVRDKNGKALSDFMILFKGLHDKPQGHIQHTIKNIQKVLAGFSDVVVFADLNLKLNLLWVSIKPVANTRHEIAGALQTIYPDARLVSHI
ncbi:MAG: hypothetical protein OEY67_01555 [Gammaproteobacteria bacterium]|nr:hypothetical protein [Gammaproteobacteria bacterium]